MLIDVHTHTPRRKAPPPPGEEQREVKRRPDKVTSNLHTRDDYLSAMAPVQKAIVFNIAADPQAPMEDKPDSLQYATPNVNDDTADFVRAHPDKLIGFLTVHPHDSHAIDEMNRCVQELGLKGVKLGPNYQNFDPLGDEAFAIYRRAEELGLPILFHQGTSPERFADLDYAHPRHMDRVAMAFPDLRIIMAHIGHPWQVDCCCVIRKHPNVYADISAQFYRPWSYYNAMRLATEWGVLDKLLFGSDFPVATPQETLDALACVNDAITGTKLPAVPVEEVMKIAERDSLALLGVT